MLSPSSTSQMTKAASAPPIRMKTRQLARNPAVEDEADPELAARLLDELSCHG